MYRAFRILQILPLLFVISFFTAGCGDCPKDYIISGTVTDANFIPLSDVQVRLSATLLATTGEDGLLTITGVDGQYSVRVPTKGQMFSYLAGYHIVFVKAGYHTSEADTFNVPEAGADHCGPSILLKRDAVLQLE